MIHYTSIEQSKRLLKHGLGIETADMYYGLREYDTPIPYSSLIDNFYSKGEDIPCWSLGALLEVMPQVGDRFSNYPILVRNRDGLYSFTDKMPFAEELDIDYYKTPVEAAYKTVMWLLENGYIKKEKCKFDWGYLPEDKGLNETNLHKNHDEKT